MWIVKFFKELKVWRTIRNVCKENSQFIENAGLMGMYIPKPILNAIDILKKKGGSNNEQTN